MSKPKSLLSKADNFLSIIRRLLLNGITAIVLIIFTFSIIGGVASMFSDDDVIDTKDKILWFKPSGVVVDSIVDTVPSLDSLLLGSTSVEQHELNDLLKVLNSAAEDESLAAVYVNVSELGMYYASAFEIANAVKNIKDSGKRVIAYGQNYGNNAYLISSQANEIILNKYGQISSFGFSRKREYIADTGGADLAGHQNMINALKRLGQREPEALPEQLAAFGIGEKPKSKRSQLWSSHPPLEDRIKALERRAQESKK